MITQILSAYVIWLGAILTGFSMTILAPIWPAAELRNIEKSDQGIAHEARLSSADRPVYALIAMSSRQPIADHGQLLFVDATGEPVRYQPTALDALILAQGRVRRELTYRFGAIGENPLPEVGQDTTDATRSKSVGLQWWERLLDGTTTVGNTVPNLLFPARGAD